MGPVQGLVQKPQVKKITRRIFDQPWQSLTLSDNVTPVAVGNEQKHQVSQPLSSKTSIKMRVCDSLAVILAFISSRMTIRACSSC